MFVKQAKEIVKQWVMEEASKSPNFFGAYFAGSTNWMADDALLPTTSDVDVKVVVEGTAPPDDYRMFLYHEVMIQVSYAKSKQFQSPEAILGDYSSAAHFTKPNIIADPTGQLTKIQATVSHEFARRMWVRKRCEHVREVLLETLQSLSESAPLHEQVGVWLPCACLPAHIVLVADLQNPTVRQMLVASRTILARYAQPPALHEGVLELLGSATLNRERVDSLLVACAEVFDVAKGLVETPFFGSSLLSEHARTIAIGGSTAVIKQGNHREAMWWIALIHNWCQTALTNDAPVEVQQKFTPSYHRLLGELGIRSFPDLQQRAEQIRGFLPRFWEAIEAIIEANPAIED